MADLLLVAAPPASPADAADLDALLDAVTAIKARQKQLEQQLEPLLEALNAAMAAGQLDPAFSHNDWAFAHSTGRLSYDFPPVVQQIEQQLKAAKDTPAQAAPLIRWKSCALQPAQKTTTASRCMSRPTPPDRSAMPTPRAARGDCSCSHPLGPRVWRWSGVWQKRSFGSPSAFRWR